MSRKRERVDYHLDSSNVTDLSDEEIRAILRAADELIATAGRGMLTKILKGSKDKKVLEFELDKCPAYGFYSHLTLPEISHRVDWTIENGFLMVEYFGRLPLLVFSPKGWEIERETMTDELLQTLKAAVESKDYHVITELKDRDRTMILLLLEKIQQTGNPEFIPLLRVWKSFDYKKVRLAIQQVINHLNQTDTPGKTGDMVSSGK